jgi:hypothetical protein
MDSNDKIYEVKKEIQVGSTMQLIDLNGTKKNFQSEFVFQTEDQSKNVNICVLNQEELDNGSIRFEETQRGKYSKRITFQNDKHINHYIAVRKNSADKDDKYIKAYLVIHMKELPPPIKHVRFRDNENNGNESNESNENYENNESNMEEDRDENNESNMEEDRDGNMEYNYNMNNDIKRGGKNKLNPNMSHDTREKLKTKLSRLRTDNEYNNLENGDYKKEYEEEEEEDDKEEEEEEFKKKLLEERNKRERYTNSYFIVGILLLAIFGCIFYIKKIRK